jgi:hypothetical protein
MRKVHGRSVSETLLYPPQLSLFVVFDKKAGMIRVTDSAVGEIELHSSSDLAGSLSGHDSSGRLTASPSVHSVNSTRHKPRSSFDSHTRIKDIKGPWLLPVFIELPSSESLSSTHALALPTTSAYVLTRGRQTQIVSAPLPSNLSARPPMHASTWNATPHHVSPRVGWSTPEDGSRPFLQLVAFCDEGLESQETSLANFGGGAKGKGRAEDIICADADVGGLTTYLVSGGHWHQSSADLGRHTSVMSSYSFDTIDTEQANIRRRVEQGIYGCVCKGPDDWRVFWVGSGKDAGPGEG